MNPASPMFQSITGSLPSGQALGSAVAGSAGRPLSDAAEAAPFVTLLESAMGRGPGGTGGQGRSEPEPALFSGNEPGARTGRSGEASLSSLQATHLSIAALVCTSLATAAGDQPASDAIQAMLHAPGDATGADPSAGNPQAPRFEQLDPTGPTDQVGWLVHAIARQVHAKLATLPNPSALTEGRIHQMAAQIARTAIQNLTLARPSPPPGTGSTSPASPRYAWNLHELSVQLDQAIRNVTAHSVSGNTAKAAATPWSLPVSIQPGQPASPAGRMGAHWTTPYGTVQSFQLAASGAKGGQLTGGGSFSWGDGSAAKAFEALAGSGISSVPGRKGSDASTMFDLGQVALPQMDPGPEALSRTRPMAEQVREVGRMLAERADGFVRAGGRGLQADLRLQPEELGQVRIKLELVEGRTFRAEFVAERPETAQLLNRHLEQFREAIGRHGLTVEQVRVSVQVRPVAESQPGNQHEGSREQNGPGARHEDRSEWHDDSPGRHNHHPQDPQPE